MKGLIGKKLGMTRLFLDGGRCVPVTAVLAGANVVVQVKTPEKDGYSAVQLGFGAKRHGNSPERGHARTHGGAWTAGAYDPKRPGDRKDSGEAGKPEDSKDGMKTKIMAYKLIREFELAAGETPEPGDEVPLDIFAPGDKLNVTGTSKGRGYAGVMKRHGFGGGRATHGCLTPRSGGSIGSAADPSRVVPGRKMAGHHGAVRVTARNLEVVDVRPDYGVILVKGAVPGPNGGLLLLKKSLVQPKAARAAAG
ncbi:MAG: 50S ribosomal protein L3 [Deltaproteobacteria bacterium]|jgi:large subunit ribosomal protein L3|nr:50S ribosomal protein L3 [Deltaproteobacteria bacterium]